MFENDDDDGKWTTEACIYYKLTYEPSKTVATSHKNTQNPRTTALGRTVFNHIG